MIDTIIIFQGDSTDKALLPQQASDSNLGHIYNSIIPQTNN